jgi:uncharacterized protein (DUF433 family)
MAKSHPVSVRLNADALDHVRRFSRQSDRSIGQVLGALVEEGVRMRRCPGITFTEGPTGRRATVAGSGVDVWEVIRVSRTCANRRQLGRAFPRLGPSQIEAALTYYDCYPDEIDRRIEENEGSFATLQRRSPFIKKVRA